MSLWRVSRRYRRTLPSSKPPPPIWSTRVRKRSATLWRRPWRGMCGGFWRLPRLQKQPCARYRRRFDPPQKGTWRSWELRCRRCSSGSATRSRCPAGSRSWNKSAENSIVSTFESGGSKRSSGFQPLELLPRPGDREVKVRCGKVPSTERFVLRDNRMDPFRVRLGLDVVNLPLVTVEQEGPRDVRRQDRPSQRVRDAPHPAEHPPRVVVVQLNESARFGGLDPPEVRDLQGRSEVSVPGLSDRRPHDHGRAAQPVHEVERDPPPPIPEREHVLRHELRVRETEPPVHEVALGQVHGCPLPGTISWTDKGLVERWINHRGTRRPRLPGAPERARAPAPAPLRRAPSGGGRHGSPPFRPTGRRPPSHRGPGPGSRRP